LRDVGLSELHACESLLRQSLVHLLRLRFLPDGPVRHWQAEAVGFLADAQARFTPSMPQRIDLDGLYRKTLRQVRAEGALGDVPKACPF
jgi:hypothetical protein